jgi:uncharacterized membrane protein
MRYLALRIIMWFFYLLAALWAIGGIVACVQIANGQLAFTAPTKPPMGGMPQGGMGEGWAIIATALGTLVMVLITLAFAQIIRVVLDIESNTRRGADALTAHFPAR